MTRNSAAARALCVWALVCAAGCVDKSPPPLWPSPPPPSVATPIGRPIGGMAALTSEAKDPVDAAKPVAETPPTDPSTTVWSEPPAPLSAPPPPVPAPTGEKPTLRDKFKESLKGTIEGARDRLDESREERAAKQRQKQQQRLEKQRRKPVKPDKLDRVDEPVP